jgi:predicted alpha/beta hydrolase family esterase
LSAAGFPTFFELFPDSIEARAQYWLPFLREHVRAGRDDVLVGWSCGSVAAMRYAQEQPVQGLVLIAPYFSDLGMEQVRRSGWVTEPWDWARIIANAPRRAIFRSDDDPYISQGEFAALEQHLATEAICFPGAGHFADQDTFPALTEHILRTYGAD